MVRVCLGDWKITGRIGGGKPDARKRLEIQEAEELGLREQADRQREELDDWNRAANRHLAAQVAETADIEGSIDRAAEEGFKEGQNNISGFIKGIFKFLGRAVKGVGFGIPIWVWLLAGAVAFFYFGGGQILKALIKKKVKP
jgi:hypothetical protein